jgi:hypothetical protein
VAARPDQAVDARPAAQHLAHRKGRRAPVERRRRLALELPVAGAAEILEPDRPVRYLGNVVAAAGLQQQHLHVGVLGKPPRHGTARGTGAADNEIVLLPEVLPVRRLLRIGPLGEARHGTGRRGGESRRQRRLDEAPPIRPPVQERGFEPVDGLHPREAGRFRMLSHGDAQ